MEGGAKVTGNTTGAGGVSIGKGGTFTMRDKTSVSGNTGSGNGGGVSSNGGTFTMWDNASVSGNTVNSGGSGGGGGVYIENGGTFTMQNGSISGNTADYGGGVYIHGGAFTKTGGTIHGSDAEQGLRNTATSGKGYAMYNQNGNWRSSTVDSTMNIGSYGFWLNDEGEFSLPLNFAGTWKRADFNNTLTFAEKTVRISSNSYTYELLDRSGNSYTLQRSGGNPFTLTIYLTNGSLEISGDSGTGQGNWNGTWKKQ